MPFAARQDSSKGKEKIDTSAIEGINPQTHASKYLAADIGRMVSKLTKDKLSSVLLTDIFNMLVPPVPETLSSMERAISLSSLFVFLRTSIFSCGSVSK